MIMALFTIDDSEYDEALSIIDDLLLYDTIEVSDKIFLEKLREQIVKKEQITQKNYDVVLDLYDSYEEGSKIKD
jgi:hypothetical protein